MRNQIIFLIPLLLMSITTNSFSQEGRIKRKETQTRIQTQRNDLEIAKKAENNRFKNSYVGLFDGRKATMKFEYVPSKRPNDKELKVTLAYQQSRSRIIYTAKIFVKNGTHILEDVTLNSVIQRSRPIIIKKIFLHTKNNDYVTVITSGDKGGVFSQDENNYNTFEYHNTPFENENNFIGDYFGVFDGENVSFKITKLDGIFQFNLTYSDRQIVFGKFISEKEIAKGSNILSDLELPRPDRRDTLILKFFILNKDKTGYIYGYFIKDGKEYGFHLLKGLHYNYNLLTASPWPLPQATSLVELTSKYQNAKTLGEINQRVKGVISRSGYADKPINYFATPGGFALVTHIEQVQCDGNPAPEENRWTVPQLSPSVGFIDDVLAFFKFADPAYYRMFIFVVTDDCTNKIGLTEDTDWIDTGSNKLPESIAQRSFTSNHCCRLYMYQFKKSWGSATAKQISSSSGESCTTEALTHIKKTNLEFN